MISTPITKMFGIQHPILLAGMGNVSGAELAAAVTNAGGLGVVGGFGWTPKMLREHLKELKSFLKDPKAPFGVDLLLPQVGGENARKTNKDYTDGKLPELIDIIIEEGAKLFVCAVGVPPAWVVEKLHKNNIVVANMVGHPRHAKKAIESGVDLIIAQGTEAGGHTGDIATTVLIPQVVDACKGAKSPLLGGPVYVIAAGGIYDGRGLAASLGFGAVGVWVGTRFVACKESNASSYHHKLIVEGDSGSTIRTTAYTGRPLRIFKNDYNSAWEEERLLENKKLRDKGIIPVAADMQKWEAEGNPPPLAKTQPFLLGQAIGGIKEILTAKEIIDSMISEAVEMLNQAQSFVVQSKSAPKSQARL